MDTLGPRFSFSSIWSALRASARRPWVAVVAPNDAMACFLLASCFCLGARAALRKSALSARCDDFHQDRRLQLFSLDIGETKRPKGLLEGLIIET